MGGLGAAVVLPLAGRTLHERPSLLHLLFDVVLYDFAMFLLHGRGESCGDHKPRTALVVADNSQLMMVGGGKFPVRSLIVYVDKNAFKNSLGLK